MRSVFLFVLSVWTCLGVTNSMTYTDKSGSSRTNEPIQFGRVFSQGEIANYPKVLVDGSPVTTQANVLQRWPDTSVKHAVVSFILASASANGSKTFTFQNQATCNCTALTKNEMLDAAYDFDATVTAAGTTISARTRLSAWDGTTTGVTGFQQWLPGPIANTLIIADHLTPPASGDITVSGFASLRVIFHATFWPGINKVRVRYILEASNTQTAQDITYDALLESGNASPSTVYDSTGTWASGVPHKVGTNWTKVAWVGGAPDDRYDLDPNLAYMISTHLLPNFDTSKAIAGSQITSDYSAWNGGTKDIYQSHGSVAYTWDSAMTDAGARRDIGPLPVWYLRWAWTGDYRERQIMLGNADLAGAWGVNYREGATGKFFDLAGTVPALGRVVSTAARPTISWNTFWTGVQSPSGLAADRITPVGTVTNANATPWIWDSAHPPAPFFLPYMVTGDYYYLEGLRFWNGFTSMYPSTWSSGSPSNSARGASKSCGGVYLGQIRSEAWGARERYEAAWAEPDGTAEKDLFTAWVHCMNNIFYGVAGLSNATYNSADTYGNWIYGHTTRRTNGVITYDTTNLPPLADKGTYLWRYNAAGFVGTGQTGYGVDAATCNRALSMFELGYLTYALGRGYELGFDTSGLLRYSVGPHYVAILTDASFNPYLIQSGRFCTQKVGPSYPSDMADQLTTYYPSLAAAQAQGAIIWQGIATLPLSNAEGGFEIINLAATAAISPFATGGTAAWAWMATNVLPASIFNTASDPRWALLPRDTTTPAAAIGGNARIGGRVVLH